MVLMMSAKLATLGLLKIKAFCNRVYDVIISAYDVMNEILSRGSNYIEEVIMSIISKREVIITSTL